MDVVGSSALFSSCVERVDGSKGGWVGRLRRVVAHSPGLHPGLRTPVVVWDNSCTPWVSQSLTQHPAMDHHHTSTHSDLNAPVSSVHSSLSLHPLARVVRLALAVLARLSQGRCRASCGDRPTLRLVIRMGDMHAGWFKALSAHMAHACALCSVLLCVPLTADRAGSAGRAQVQPRLLAAPFFPPGPARPGLAGMSRDAVALNCWTIEPTGPPQRGLFSQ